MTSNRNTAYQIGLTSLLTVLLTGTLACRLATRAGSRGASSQMNPSPVPGGTAVPLPTSTNEPGPTATPPGPSGRIVFTCQIFAESRRNQLCTVSPTGQSLRRLTLDDAADHFYPSWAPDGERVVFSSNLGGGYEIFEMALRGAPRQLTHHGRAYAPAISPDGERLVFTVRDGERTALWIAARDGSQARWLAGRAWDAAWSPDGAWILHASDRGGSIQLWLVRPDGSGLKQVTHLEGLRGRSDWSPTGDRLATYAGSSWSREIVTFSPDGADVRRVTDEGNNLAPSFSPDGGWIAFTSYRDNYRDENGCEVYVMQVDGSDVRRLTENQYCDWQPRWSPK